MELELAQGHSVLELELSRSRGIVAYTLKDKRFDDFEVLKSANAWWMNRAKVEELIECVKIKMSIEKTCEYIGISLDQYKYFVVKHPEFSTIRAKLSGSAYEALIRKGIYNKIEKGDTKTLLTVAPIYLDEWKKDAEPSVSPTLNNFGTIIHQTAPVVDESVLVDVIEYESSKSSK